MQTTQLAVVVSTAVILLLTVVLAAYTTRKYLLKRKNTSYLWWGLGLWAFAVAVLLELAFALNYYSSVAMNAYLLLVVLIVEFLALGSMQLINNHMVRKAFYIFVLAVTAANVYALAVSNTGNLVMSYVVAGNPPLLVIITSSVATFASAAAIVIIGAMSYVKTFHRKLLYIIVGVIVVSVAGTLYIASIPELLYLSEFVGIVLLWMGLV